MVLLMDSHRAVDITIRPHMDGYYGPDWSADFFNVGELRHYPVIKGPREGETVHIVDYVGGCISSARDMVAGVGDFEMEGPQPEQVVDIEEINVDGVRLQSCIGPDLQTGTNFVEFRRDAKTERAFNFAGCRAYFEAFAVGRWYGKEMATVAVSEDRWTVVIGWTPSYIRGAMFEEELAMFDRIHELTWL